MQRLIGLVPPEVSDGRSLTFEDLRGHIEALIDVRVTHVNWFSTYRVHHRVAERFRHGRAFLAGDAGHIHSPAGGQGMNTGIGDAINLGWKLANVIQTRADHSLLDTYEPERIGFARSLVSTTDRAFTGMVASGLTGELARKIIAPLIFSVATRFSLSRHAIFRTVSQTKIHYPESPLSQGTAGQVHAGDRLPWNADLENTNNFASLRSLEWQAHVYGDVRQELQLACGELNLPLHRFAWNKGADEAGFERDACYLVRPDGYVGLALPRQSEADLRAYVKRWKLSFPKLN
jgi:hypothetical protein